MHPLTANAKFLLTSTGRAPTADASVAVNVEVVQLIVLLAVLSVYWKPVPAEALTALGFGDTVAVEADAVADPTAPTAHVAKSMKTILRSRSITNLPSALLYTYRLLTIRSR